MPNRQQQVTTARVLGRTEVWGDAASSGDSTPDWPLTSSETIVREGVERREKALPQPLRHAVQHAEQLHAAEHGAGNPEWAAVERVADSSCATEIRRRPRHRCGPSPTAVRAAEARAVPAESLRQAGW